ncbi:serine--tRNA ligase [Gorillibacterium timonense]|uniref:serine--tRNA ligase n=1 Tax=Gorillibacterium timonense TaxID=1689269 RepID=UPI00071D12EF|nr:serine--tRNA ligase [Gorillibacterium timonense]
MLDMKIIRQQPELVQAVANRKGIEVSVERILERDRQKREIQQKVEELRRERNERSERIGRLMRSKPKKVTTSAAVQRGALYEPERAAVKKINDELAALETEWTNVSQELEELLLLVPNLVSPDTPEGLSDADNVELKRVGEPPQFAFPTRDHVELGESLGLIDISRGVKVAGTRNYYLTGIGAMLHRAVQQLAVDLLIKRGFTLLDVPLMVRPDAMTSTGFFPFGQDQVYRVEDEGKCLVGTSEAPLVAYYGGEIVNVKEPIRLTAATACFRSEIGSAGRDVRGLYRVHQFAKVEQVVICEADYEISERCHQEITANAEELLSLLELPYRVVAVCIGDMSQKTYKQFDIETWMPSRNAYGETHSASNLGDFQARRAGIRYRGKDSELRYCHTLNNTAVATPRILIPLLENHQNEDGSVTIPEALRPYLNGMTVIHPIAGPKEPNGTMTI